MKGRSEQGMRIPPSAGGLLAGLWLMWPSDELASNQSPRVSVALY